MGANKKMMVITMHEKKFIFFIFVVDTMQNVDNVFKVEWRTKLMQLLLYSRKITHLYCISRESDNILWWDQLETVAWAHLETQWEDYEFKFIFNIPSLISLALSSGLQ